MAEGFVTVAVENMANAIKKISVQRGYDVTEYLLNCFGGAGGQHACLVADALGMEAVLIHPFSGLLSAYGIGLSGVFASRQQALLKPLAAGIAGRHRPACRRTCATPCWTNWPRKASLRTMRPGDRSCTSAMTAPTPRCRSISATARSRCARQTFEALHKAQFGFVYDNKPMVVEAVGVEGSDGRKRGRDEADSALEEIDATPSTTRQIFVDGNWCASRHLSPRGRCGPATACMARR